MNRLLYILILLLPVALIADDDSYLEETFETYFVRLFDGPGHVVNQPTIRAEYGLSFPSVAGNFDTDLANSYSLGLYYGFTRIEDDTDVEDVFDHAQEYAFLSSITSHLKTQDLKSRGITMDVWRFGFGRKDGLGYNFGDNSRLFLSHTGAIAFTRIDFEYLAPDRQDQKFLERMDEKFRFGTIYRTDVDMQLFSSVHISLGYVHAVVHPDFSTWQWLGSLVFDVTTQRWMDVFEPDLLREFGKNWPWMRLITQSIISAITYEFRRHQQSWPFTSERPISFETVKIGFMFIF